MRLPAVPAIPGYDLLEVLGAGGMGVVWKARQRRLDRIVAVKLIRPELVQPDVVEAFRREARAVAKLAHPNIVTIHDADEAEGTHYLVMELVEGTDLGRLVVERGPLPGATACAFARQAALALQHASERGVVHRDVKPSNLMLAQPAGVVKMLDLGLARWRGPSGGNTTSFANLVGTPDFVAPEQIEKPGHADARSDLYSLGCTLYYLLTGTVPFPAPTLAHKLDGHRWETPVPVGQRRADIEPRLQAMVARLLAKRPEDRHQTAAELADDLEPLAGSAVTVPVTASPSPSLAPGRRLACPDVPLCLAFAPDGATLVAAGAEMLLAWDVATGAERWRHVVPDVAAAALAFTPNGRRFVTAGNVLRVHDAGSGAVLRSFPSDAAIQCVAVLADGKTAVTGDADSAIYRWNLRTGKRRAIGGLVTERHWDAVLAVAVAGEHAISGSADGTLREWDVRTGHERRALRPGRGAVCWVAFADGEPVGAGADWCGQHGITAATCGAFCADGRQLITGSADGCVRRWEVATGRQLSCQRVHSGPAACVAIAPDGRLAAGGTDHRVWLAPE